MCTDEDDNNSGDHAIVMKRSVDDDVLSVRSMPLQKDDDYFYYHGEGEDDGDDEDGETVDHIGLLISHPSLSIVKQPLVSSPRSTTSDISLDASIPDEDNDEDPQLDDDDFNAFYSTQECAHLKDEIADLRAQLDDQKKQFEERNMSLEYENVGLKVMLKETQEIAQNNLSDARTVERILQDKLDKVDDDINAFYSTQECAHLKDEIADLRAQLDDQKKQFEERNMSLEYENVGLKVMLKETQEIAQNNLSDARTVERILQDKLDKVTRELSVLKKIYAPSTPQESRRQLRRHLSSETGAKSQFREEDYVPFPQSHDVIRRRRTITICNDISPQRILSNSSGLEEKKTSLLASLFRATLRRGSNNSDDVPSEISTNVSSGLSSESHYSWAHADEINAQTGIFNQKSSEKLREKMTSSTSVCSSQHEPSQRRIRRRRRSFAFGQQAGEDDESIDVKSQLWDSFVDENAKMQVQQRLAMQSVAL